MAGCGADSVGRFGANVSTARPGGDENIKRYNIQQAAGDRDKELDMSRTSARYRPDKTQHRCN